jgi:chromosome segregation ATPase
MTAEEKTLNTFTTRVRQMLLRFTEVKKENDDLYALVDERDQEIKRLTAQLKQAQNDYQSLKMAKMMEITDGDLEEASKRLSKLIRDVNKCITLVSEK